MGESYRLRSVTVEVEPRGDYLHLVLRGEVPTLEDARQLTSLVRRVMETQAIRRVLMSARELDEALPKEAWDAVWAWLSERRCRQFAWVAPVGATELTVTTLNLTAMAQSLSFRAFTTVVDACRWLELRSTGSGRVAPAEVAGGVRDSSRGLAAPSLGPGDRPAPQASSRSSRVDWLELGGPAERGPSSGGMAAVREPGERPSSRHSWIDPQAQGTPDSNPVSSAERRASSGGLAAVRESGERPSSRHSWIDPQTEQAPNMQPETPFDRRSSGERRLNLGDTRPSGSPERRIVGERRASNVQPPVRESGMVRQGERVDPRADPDDLPSSEELCSAPRRPR